MIKFICDFCGEEIKQGEAEPYPRRLVFYEQIDLRDTINGTFSRSDHSKNHGQKFFYSRLVHKECADQITKTIQPILANLKPRDLGIIGG